MHWKKTTFVIIIILLLFLFVSDWTSCRGLCGATQRQNSIYIFLFILVFTIIFLYYSLSIWITYKKKYIEKEDEKK